MAGMEAKTIAALLSLLAAALFLLQGPAAALLRSALDLQFDGRRLLDLANRRNMILLCNAILLVILKDAGLLASPARRSTTASTAASASGAACSSQPQLQPEAAQNIQAAASSVANGATVSDDDGPTPLRRGRRSPRSARAMPRVRRGLPLSAAAERRRTTVQHIDLTEKHSSHDGFNFDLDAAVKEIHVLEKHSSFDRFNDDNSADQQIALVDDTSSRFHSEQQIADDERSRGEETEADNADEMNKRFEDFIANMRRNMQLECLQLVKV